MENQKKNISDWEFLSGIEKYKLFNIGNWTEFQPQNGVIEIPVYTHPGPLGLGWKVWSWNCADVSIFFFIKLSTKTYLTGYCYDLNDTEGELTI